MRKIFFSFLFCFAGLVFFPCPALAAEKINSFESDIIVQKDATVLVTETIVYDFGEEERHGIFRETPFIYRNQEGKKFKIDFQVLSVTDEKRVPYKYNQSRKGENISLRIGDPNKYVTSEKNYVIAYKVRGVITYFKDHDELFWNVTGNGWQVPILSAHALVTLPQGISSGVKAICFTGRLGAKEKDCQFLFETSNKAVFSTTDLLAPFWGLSVALSFPKNIVAYVEPKEVGMPAYLKITLIILATGYYLIAPFVILYLWLKYGRDPKVGKPVRAWYDPPKDRERNKLSPAEVGTLVDEFANERDLAATIVDLAIKGYLKIKQEGKEHLFLKRRELEKDETLKLHEKMLLKSLFLGTTQVSTAKLKRSFYKESEKIMNKLYEMLVEEGFFPENPKSVRNKFYLLGILGFITLNFPLGALAFLFGRVMPRKTFFGAQAKIQALGLKNFLTSQERPLEFQEKNWYFFEKLLPFAIVFNVAHLWAKRFKGIFAQPPDWYEGEYKGEFTPVVFTDSLLKSTSKFESVAAMSSSRSSTGFSSGFSGGSSGGGFGGGGGGSW